MFSHPNFGRQILVRQSGKRVKLIFVSDNVDKASDLFNYLLDQLRNGTLNIAIHGEPTDVQKGRQGTS